MSTRRQLRGLQLRVQVCEPTTDDVRTIEPRGGVLPGRGSDR